MYVGLAPGTTGPAVERRDQTPVSRICSQATDSRKTPATGRVSETAVSPAKASSVAPSLFSRTHTHTLTPTPASRSSPRLPDGRTVRACEHKSVSLLSSVERKSRPAVCVCPSLGFWSSGRSVSLWKGTRAPHRVRDPVLRPLVSRPSNDSLIHTRSSSSYPSPAEKRETLLLLPTGTQASSSSFASGKLQQLSLIDNDIRSGEFAYRLICLSLFSSGCCYNNIQGKCSSCCCCNSTTNDRLSIG